MTTQPQTIIEYIAGFPRDLQAVLKKVRATIRKAAPDADEAIKYKIAAYVQDGKNLVFFAGHARHVGMYPLPKKLSKQLAQYAHAKGTARFPLDQPIPYPLIERTVKALLAELRNAAKTIKPTKTVKAAKAAATKPSPRAAVEVERVQRDAGSDSPRTAAVPDDLELALKAKPRARALFAELSSANRSAILWQLQTTKKPETRARRIERFLSMLEHGETLH
jgi:uncharacterized protein YdhG (YjbR/CyaY superfamily)